VSFSVEELSKLEMLLNSLHLPPDEASELQAKVLERLMDVYHKLTLQSGQVRVLYLEVPGVGRGSVVTVPVALCLCMVQDVWGYFVGSQ
jgi:hypothetical protein